MCRIGHMDNVGVLWGYLTFDRKIVGSGKEVVCCSNNILGPGERPRERCFSKAETLGNQVEILPPD